MKIRRTAAITTLTVLPLALTGLGAGSASAHGTSQNPPSRIQLCSTQGGENPENFRLSACRAAKEAVGNNPQPFYDPNAVNIAAAGGRHKELIPDGKLCSAGNPQYAGLDLPRTDWPTTNLPSGGAYTFRFLATAPHKGTFQYFITKDGFDVTKPLKWSDLEDKPIATATDPKLENGAYVIPGTLPKKSGRHLIYIVWQRSDSQEAFYSCSDVAFDGSGKPAPAPPTTPAQGGAAGGASGGDHTDHNAHTGSSGAQTTAPAANPPAASAGSTGSTGSATSGATSGSAAGTGGTGASAGAAPALAAGSGELAHTGGDSGTSVTILGTAAAVLALGAGSLVYARRRSTR
ncbi:lytic polysaccharide monooxygenase auxiliary activity family 9 protein [Yinghuangia seranimata]|uniref:lytic polysaccharide monooxygenase auxiliary activity family 9 protein n=1 Tax=Yinghuangia seranimata TaxID=408067 RepID=UPI00248AA9A9|nr:lytic polysaccharide monooxygenase [Yinghuangia seranimata]MDI2132823.1 lytic polysaccharide monooxygenase [Yinghuangia seranimata]